jgi:hypothetical protein
MRETPSPSPEPKRDYGVHETPPPSPEPMRDFGMRASLSPSPEPKRDFGMRASLSPSPEPKRDFGMRATLSPSPEPKRDFGMRATLSASPEPKRDIRMRKMLSNSPEIKRDYGRRASSPSPEPSISSKRKRDFGMCATPSPEPQDILGISEPVPQELQGDPARSQGGDAVQTASPLPHAEDFGVFAVSEEFHSQIGAHQLTEAEEPNGSLSNAHGKFHTYYSYTYLTLLYVEWDWGKRAPPLIPRSEKNPPGAAAGVERAHESVC